MKEKKSITKNSIFYLIYNILNVIFPFLTGIYVTHILLPDAIGQVETARNFVQYFVIFSFLGIPTYGLREVSKNRNDQKKLNKIYTELMLINSISTFVFCIIYAILILIIPRCAENIVLYSIVGISLVMNFLNNSWLYEGLEEFKYISLRNLLFKLLSFLALILFVKSSEDYLIYALITVIGTVGNYILNIVHARKFVKFELKNLNLKQHISAIIYLVVVNLAIEIYSLVDITMLGIFCDNNTVAFYSYGTKIYRIILQIVNTFTMVLVPRIALYFKENKKEEFNALITKTVKVIIIITIPTIIGINFTSSYLITKIYGPEYIRSAVVLNILSFILLISPMGYLLGSRILLVVNKEKKMIIPVAIGALVNIIGNYILINKYAEIGAAIASLISEIIVMIIYITLGKKYFQLKSLKENIVKVFIAVSIMSIYLFIISKLKLQSMIITFLQIIGACIIYCTILYSLKEEFLYNFIENKIKRRISKWKEDRN